MGLTGVNHTSFTVADVKASAKWYCEKLGFEVMSDAVRDPAYCEKVTGIHGAHLHIIYVRGAGYPIELIQYIGGAGVKIDTATNNVGSAHVCFNVDSLHAMYAALKRQGVRFMSPPVGINDGPNKGGLVVYMEDLDGNTLELIQPPRH